jgi:hypothetical protein
MGPVLRMRQYIPRFRVAAGLARERALTAKSQTAMHTCLNLDPFSTEPLRPVLILLFLYPSMYAGKRVPAGMVYWNSMLQ